MHNFKIDQKFIAKFLHIVFSTLFSTLSLASPEESKIILWHAQDGQQVIFLKALMAAFSKLHPAYEVKVEDVLEFSVSLHKAAQFGFLPDVIFAPGDMVSLKDELELSTISRTHLNPKTNEKTLATVKLDGQFYGAPVLGGNHLLVYWNKALIKSAPQSARELKWPLNDSYFFLPFLVNGQAVDFEETKLKRKEVLKVLEEYRIFGIDKNSNLLATCAYNCLVNQFYQGNIPAIINGEWAYEDSFTRLGQNLEVSSLPRYNGIELTSPGGSFSLMFPKNGLSKSKRSGLLALVAFMQSEIVQQKFLRIAKRIPVHQDVLTKGKQRASDTYRRVLSLSEQSFAISPNARLPYFWAGVSKGLGHLNLHAASIESSLKIMNAALGFAEYESEKKELK